MSSYSLLTNKNGIKWDISANNVDLISLNGNGTSGQVLSSNGPNVAPSWVAGGGSSNISITDTSTNSIFYPTFVSGSGAGQTLRADITSNPLTFNPSTGVLTTTAFVGSSVTAPANTNMNISSNYTSSSGTGQVIIENTATGSNRSSQLILKSGKGTVGGFPEPSAQLICNTATATYPSPSIQLITGPLTNTNGVLITNNVNSSGQTNTINCSNANIEITSDLLGDFGQFLQLSLSNTIFSMTNIEGYLFEIENGLFTSNGNLTFGNNPQTNLQMGLLERGKVDNTTSGSTSLDWDDCFLTIISSPTGSRAFVLQTPDLPVIYSGYWVAICNRSRANTIAVKQLDPSGTLITLYTIPLNPSENNFSGGSTARFAVSPTGLSWFRVS